MVDAQSRWTTLLPRREMIQARMALEYVAHFNHGAPGHLDLVLIAKLVTLLDATLDGAQSPEELQAALDGMLAAPTSD